VDEVRNVSSLMSNSMMDVIRVVIVPAMDGGLV
jgi:hypothetical protein